MMEVTRSNLKQVLPTVAEAIKDASFLTIDGEFTGLHNGRTMHSFETPEERYANVREGAMEFLAVQIGLCAFQYIENENRYTVKPFNFYIFPRGYGRNSPEHMFLSQSSCLEFLVSKGFDFNKLFKDGMSYMRPDEEQKIREQMMQRHQQSLQNSNDGGGNDQNFSRSPVTIPPEWKTYLENVCEKVLNFFESDETYMELAPCNAFARKLIYQEVKSKYQKYDFHIDTKVSDNGDRFIVITKANAQQRQNLQLNKQKLELDVLDQAVGFSKVVKLITESGKPVVGHNMLLDVCHVIHQCCHPLPTDYDDFKALTQAVFPKLIDTKLMGSTSPLRDMIMSTALNELLTTVSKPPFKEPVLDTAIGFPVYSTLTEKLHEAGYDAFITGICFITMSNYLSGIQDSSKIVDVAKSSVIEPFLNKIFLMKVNDLNYINLGGDDVRVSRDHVFHITFPKEWKTSDLMELFSPFGNVSIAWLNDNSAFIGLYRKDQSEIVMRTLTQSDTYHVQTYRNYLKQMNIKWMSTSTPDWVLTSNKRSLPEPDFQVPSKKSRSVGNESQSVTKRSIDTIPEEDEDDDEQEEGEIPPTTDESENDAMEVQNNTHTLVKKEESKKSLVTSSKRTLRDRRQGNKTVSDEKTTVTSSSRTHQRRQRRSPSSTSEKTTSTTVKTVKKTKKLFPESTDWD